MQYPSLEKLTSTVVDFFNPDYDNHLWYLEEKIDGSQLSFRFEQTVNGLQFYNKNHTVSANNVFGPSMKNLTAKFAGEKLALVNPNFTYHGEALCKRKHNVIQYKRPPKNYWICYDIYDKEGERWLTREEKVVECERIDLEIVPCLYQNSEKNVDPHGIAKKFIDQMEGFEIESVLGGPAEGLVLKHPHFFRKGVFTSKKKKMVTKQFKEKQKEGTAKIKLETTADDYIRELAKPYNVVPRFRKALIHLKELDNWSDDPLKRETNIARLKKELDTDFQKEYLEEIKEKMWTELGPIIMESARKDLQEWADALYPKEEEIVEQHDEDFDFEHNSETNSGQDNKCDCSHCPFAETKQVLDVINDPTRDVLAIFHVPWCTHCKNLGPVFEELRKHPARKSITIIKINSSRLNTSMAPELRVGAYPTIRFYGKNSKIGATYSGDHTLENLVHFVNSFKKSE